ncbi:MAG TPA: DUF2062 domain-containing protein [Prosthecobacter sp.]|nr:DUF2062 domain-containing protein [Prosthecobacter sp.]
MVEFAKGYFRRSLFKTYRFLKHPRKLKKSRVMRWFARHFLHKHVWRPTQHTLAGGMAVGMFVTMQLLPIQMATATILAAIFRVNIPLAVALSWVSNPLTVPFLAVIEYKIGKWILAWYTKVPSTPFPKHLPESGADMWLALREHSPVMLFGGLILGALVTPVTYGITYLSWGGIKHWFTERKQPVLPLTPNKD